MASVIYILTVSFSHSLFVISVLWLPPDSLPEKHGLQIKLNSHTAPNLLGFMLLQESVAEPSSYPSHTLTSVLRSPVSPIIASFTSVLHLSSAVSTLTSGDPFENRYVTLFKIVNLVQTLTPLQGPSFCVPTCNFNSGPLLSPDLQTFLVPPARLHFCLLSVISTFHCSNTCLGCGWQSASLLDHWRQGHGFLSDHISWLGAQMGVVEN